MEHLKHSDEEDPPAATAPLDWTRVDNWWWAVIAVLWFLDAVLDTPLPSLIGSSGVGAFAQSLIDRHVDVLLTALGLALIATVAGGALGGLFSWVEDVAVAGFSHLAIP